MLLSASSDWNTIFLQASNQGLNGLGIIVFPKRLDDLVPEHKTRLSLARSINFARDFGRLPHGQNAHHVLDQVFVVVVEKGEDRLEDFLQATGWTSASKPLERVFLAVRLRRRELDQRPGNGVGVRWNLGLLFARAWLGGQATDASAGSRGTEAMYSLETTTSIRLPFQVARPKSIASARRLTSSTGAMHIDRPSPDPVDIDCEAEGASALSRLSIASSTSRLVTPLAGSELVGSPDKTTITALSPYWLRRRS